MSPLGQIVPSNPPTWPLDLIWPNRDTGGTGVGIDPDNAGKLGFEAGTTADPTLSAGTTGGTGATSNFTFFRGQICGLQRSSGVDPSASWGFPWWNPNWGDGTDLPAGFAPDPLATVAIFDVFFVFELAASSFSPGETGCWFTVRPSNAESDEDRPAGSTPRTCLGFEAVDDGSGGQTLAFGAWDNTGARLSQVMPPTALAPLLWNTAQITIIGAGPGRAAQVFEVRFNGELAAQNLDFGTATLQRPSTLVSSLGQTLVMMYTVEGGPNDAWAFRWRARFGTIRADGVEVTT